MGAVVEQMEALHLLHLAPLHFFRRSILPTRDVFYGLPATAQKFFGGHKYGSDRPKGIELPAWRWSMARSRLEADAIDAGSRRSPLTSERGPLQVRRRGGIGRFATDLTALLRATTSLRISDYRTTVCSMAETASSCPCR
jgi:hypothetical protein